ncbi:Rpr2-domain-containing protein [Wolfiporia cocos MD-104 SS10]|uniref:Rpr2-domain-containing protein n=1 Tax=Wolfiporia cocos (strain MD-104) TaxID=742152 RepID=A0A2H3JEH7_WOLCO|nr:Rpr2-domain-containing protein [Wolfiporia cocos MD-104 SS10]
MAKKIKGQEPAVSLNSVTNRDILQRLNFLYQASAYLNTINPDRTADARVGPDSSSLSKRQRKRQTRRKERHPNTAADLSRNYVKTMKIVAQKATVKMDPNVKRTICKKCSTVLIPGVSARIRVESSRVHGNVVQTTCIHCHTARCIPALPELGPDAPPVDGPSTSSATDISPQDLPAPEIQIPSGEAQPSEDAMVADIATPQAIATGPSAQAQTESEASMARIQQQKQRRRTLARLPPLFQRKGHIVFKGNERLEEE